LNGGSITSGFGSIDNGSSAITTTGTVTFGTLSDGSINIANFIDDDTFGTASATTVATSESIKAYVDSQVGTVDTLAEILANGNTTGGTDISLSSSDITGTGNIDITGTVTADGLTVTGTLGNFAVDTQGAIVTLSRPSTSYIRASDASGSLRFDTGGSVGRLLLANNGDISFYEDTGTSQALFWDASAESLRVPLSLYANSINAYPSEGYAAVYSTGAGGSAPFNEAGHLVLQARSSGALRDIIFATGNGATERMRIDSSGNVGIGTASPATALEVNGDIGIGRVAGGYTFRETVGGGERASLKSNASNELLFSIGAASEAMRIDSSGLIRAVSSITSDPTNTNAYFYNKSGVGPTLSGFQFSIRTGSTPDEAMRIDSSGNVGIGTSSPDTSLQIGDISATNATGQGRIKLEDSSTALSSIGGLEFTTSSFGSGYGWKVNSIDSGGGVHLVFGTRQNSTTWSESMRIDSSGNVGIGTSSPSEKLTVDAQSADGVTTTIASFHSNEGESGDTAIQLAVRRSDSLASDRKTFLNATGAGNFEIQRSGSTKAVIDSSGNVGIGTDSPSQPLHVDASGGGVVRVTRLGNSASAYGQLEHDGTNTTLKSSAQLIFNSGGSETARIDSSGNLLVGGTSSGQDDSFAASSSGNITIARASGSTRTMASFLNGGGTVGSIVTSTTATTYNTSSDARLKDVTGEARGLEVINELNPVAYNWKADGKADEGLIAQEVQEIVPNAVSGSEEEHYQMDYSKLVVHLVKAVKEQQTQIEALQSEINLLKGE
jgi:hypothetical protein